MSDAASNHRLQHRAADEPSRTIRNTPTNSLQLSPLLTAKEAAARLKVSVSWLAKARMRGDGPPYICVGRAIRYAEAALIPAVGSPARCPKLSPRITIPPILRKISRTRLTPTANSYDSDAKLITPFETFASTAST
jgi:Helix-turn-helix domain